MDTISKEEFMRKLEALITVTDLAHHVAKRAFDLYADQVNEKPAESGVKYARIKKESC